MSANRTDNSVTATAMLSETAVEFNTANDSDVNDLPPRPPISPITPYVPYATPILNSNMYPPPRPPDAPSQGAQQISPPPTLASQTPQALQLAQQPKQPATFITQPAPQPITLETNTDAAALRAALSVLHLQRQKARKDITTLQQLQAELASDPKSFTEALLTGKMTQDLNKRDPLAPTLADESSDDDEDEDDSQEKDNSSQTAAPPPNADGDAVAEVRDTDIATEQVAKSDVQESPSKAKHVTKFPTPQNIIRMPPVNWAKYGVVGEPLDSMHEDQRRRPSGGEPAWDGSGTKPVGDGVLGSGGTGAREHVIAAAYDPKKDPVGGPTGTGMGLKGSSAPALGTAASGRKDSKK